MTEQEKQILKTFCQAFPLLTEAEKEHLLAFGEGMAFKAEQMHKRKEMSA